MESGLAEIEDVYRRRYRAFLHVAVALLGDRERAHDAVQEAFARAIKSRFQHRGDASLEAWVWGILVNHCRDVAGRRSAPLVQSAGENGRSPDHADVRAAIAALPERQRLILFLRHYADLDYERIARIAGVRRGTVAATLHAARDALKRELEGTDR